MQIRSKSHNVLETGSVISYKDNPIEMIFTENGKEFIFRFYFKRDRKDTSERAEFNTINQYELEIVLFNCNRAFGIGTLEPLEMGYLYNRKLYLSYRVFSLSDSPEKLFTYTWYLGDIDDI